MSKIYGLIYKRIWILFLIIIIFFLAIFISFIVFDFGNLKDLWIILLSLIPISVLVFYNIWNDFKKNSEKFWFFKNQTNFSTEKIDLLKGKNESIASCKKTEWKKFYKSIKLYKWKTSDNFTIIEAPGLEQCISIKDIEFSSQIKNSNHWIGSSSNMKPLAIHLLKNTEKLQKISCYCNFETEEKRTSKIKIPKSCKKVFLLLLRNKQYNSWQEGRTFFVTKETDTSFESFKLLKKLCDLEFSKMNETII